MMCYRNRSSPSAIDRARGGRSGADFRRNCHAIVGSFPRRVVARAGGRSSSGRVAHRVWVQADCSGLVDRPVKPGDDSEERGTMAETGGMDGPQSYAATTVAAPAPP